MVVVPFRLLLCALTSLAGPLAARAGDAAQPVSPDPMKLAERIYREGVLSSGEPLRGIRSEGVAVSGSQAACVSCHRRSGMGTFEGNRIVPPITGEFLHHPRARAMGELDVRHTRGPDLAHALGRNRARDPYTYETLVRAIREGIDSSGNGLEMLMPRYPLSDADARLLVDYLGHLSDRVAPGVTPDTIHFGTVVTPGVDPARRKALLDVLQAFFAVKNSGTRLEKLREQGYSGSDHNPYRTWQLHVLDLEGAPESWGAQLSAYYERQPVFALLSGLSQGTWAPVHDFCESRGIPCWFPTVDLPVTAGSGFYSAYFSKGTILEAEILARHLQDPANVRAVRQIRGEDAAAAGAALALEKALAGTGIRFEERVLRSIDPSALRAAAADAGASEALVFWLRGAELAKLADVTVPSSPSYFSATLADGEHAPLPPAWKAHARILYPFELPDLRRSNLVRFHGWLKMRNLALVDERVQADAYLASLLMAAKIDEMLETLLRDYLLERAEAILSERLTTGMYRRLSLAPEQRFASKGGYVVRFKDENGSAIVADSPWITP